MLEFGIVTTVGGPETRGALSLFREGLDKLLKNQRYDNLDTWPRARIEVFAARSYENDMGIDSSLDLNSARKTVNDFVERFNTDANRFYNTQTNIDPQRALVLLKD